LLLLLEGSLFHGFFKEKSVLADHASVMKHGVASFHTMANGIKYCSQDVAGYQCFGLKMALFLFCFKSMIHMT
jgi:hypothetical protein